MINEGKDRYPLSTVILSNALSLAMYGTGAFLMLQINWLCLAVYVAYVIWLEYRLLTTSCRDCWYYGKTCAFGKGRIACRLVKPGSPSAFAERKVTWSAMVPDLMVTLVPVASSIVLMIMDFRWLLLGLMITMLVLSSVGNGFVRGKLACRFCRQRELGCPAEKLFDKQKAK